MPIYEFIQVERRDGPFELPGEIVEVCNDHPHSKQKVTYLVRIDSDSDVIQEGDGTEEEEIEYGAIDGIGEIVATRLRASGYKFPSDLTDVESQALANEIKGLGKGRAEDILEKYK